MAVRYAPVRLYWYEGASSLERAEVAAWVAVNDCSDVEVIGIDRTVVSAFGVKARLHGWGTTEMRREHDSVTHAVAEVVTRLRHMHLRT